MKRIIYGVIQLISSIKYKLSQYDKCNHPKLTCVLAYHKILPINSAMPKDKWCVCSDQFEKQMNYLKENRYVTLTVSKLIEHINKQIPLPSHSVCVTFDDGYRNNYLYAYPILKKYGLTATFYVVTDFINNRTPFAWISPESDAKKDELLRFPLSWDEICEMQDNGMEFGSHSHTHPEFNHLNMELIENEISESYNMLSSHLKTNVISFVCPFGIFGRSANLLKNKLIEKGYVAACMGGWGTSYIQTDPFDLPRLSIYDSDSLLTFSLKINGHMDWLKGVYSWWRSASTIWGESKHVKT